MFVIAVILGRFSFCGIKHQFYPIYLDLLAISDDMGDSDDDYDRKRRDKFRGERSVGADRRERRDDWVDRFVLGSPTSFVCTINANVDPYHVICRGRPKADYRDYRPPRERSSYSPGRDYPPMKRMRGDYDDSRARYGNILVNRTPRKCLDSAYTFQLQLMTRTQQPTVFGAVVVDMSTTECIIWAAAAGMAKCRGSIRIASPIARRTCRRSPAL